MSTLCFYAQFTASKTGANSLTVTWDVEQVTRSDGTRSALVTGGATSVTVGRRGLYGYVLANADLTLYDYVATAITSDATVDLKEVPALWTLWTIPTTGTDGKVLLSANAQTGVTIPTVTNLTNEKASYMHGAVWIDSVNGAAGTTSYVNGIMTNPVTTIAGAKTIADNLKLKKFWIQAGSSLTLSADMAGYVFDGHGYAFTTTGSRNVSGSKFVGCEEFTGTYTAPTSEFYI